MTMSEKNNQKHKNHAHLEKAIREIEDILERNNWEKALNMNHWLIQSKEIDAFFKAANIFALYLNYNDHGRSHGVIAARNALKIYEILRKTKPPSLVSEGFGDEDDAALVILVSAMLHDIGMAVHREVHYHHSATIALSLLRDKLHALYGDIEKSTVVLSHILHGIYAHDEAVKCLTGEAGVVAIGDGLDMEQGRSRGPYQRNKNDIHSLSAKSISKVEILPGDGNKPVVLKVWMESHAGVFQLEEILLKKMNNSGIKSYFKVETFVHGNPIELPKLNT